MISALFVISDGPYFELLNVDPWDVVRDARKYRGPNKVIAHPPCERWGRYWGGGPMLAKTEKQKLLGDDEGCFAHALWSVRTFGGVLEHPEASHAFKFFGLPIPPINGGWTDADRYGGRSCCVAQGNYGHPAQKLTWLYGKDINFKELYWGKKPGCLRLEMGPRSKDQAKSMRSSPDYKPVQRISEFERHSTPEPFRDLLIDLVTGTTAQQITVCGWYRLGIGL